ncbi:MAG: S8 family peptidase [bacterium]|nr:S8 family peptidase [bacterium]MDZ4284412.1 S8 family peptidase [Patescibacteria group bacterium]
MSIFIRSSSAVRVGGTFVLVGLLALAPVADAATFFISSTITRTLEHLEGVREDIRVVAAEMFDNVAAQTVSVGDFVQDEVVVKYKNDSEPFRVLKVPTGQAQRHARALSSRADIAYAEPNYVAHAFWAPNDTYYGLQWHLDNPTYGGVEAEDAWQALGAPGTPGAGAVVAVVDTGIAYENFKKGVKRYYQAPDLAATCFVPGKDFIENDLHPNDDNSHGTHVAGTIAQSSNNGSGVAGLAFKTCLMPVKVLDKNGSGSYTAVANGIRYAADQGVDVINLSLGGPASNVLRDAVAYAHGKGVTIVAASGNDNGAVGYPAAYDDYVIAVGATRYDETRAPYSNYGASLDIVAPGGDLGLDQNGDGYSDGVLQQTFNPNTKRTNAFGYWFFNGTSMASPHVAAVAALVIANGNARTPADVRAALESTADDLGTAGRDDQFGYGIVDAVRALGWSTTTPPAP